MARMVPQAADPIETATMRGVSAGPRGVHSPTSAFAFWAAQSFRSSGSTKRLNDGDGEENGVDGDGNGVDEYDADEDDEDDDEDDENNEDDGVDENDVDEDDENNEDDGRSRNDGVGSGRRGQGEDGENDEDDDGVGSGRLTVEGAVVVGRR